jgi:hypothetical protein
VIDQDRGGAQQQGDSNSAMARLRISSLKAAGMNKLGLDITHYKTKEKVHAQLENNNF